MNEKIKKGFTIFNGFLHDFAAGCWGATVLAIYWLDNIGAQRPELLPVLDVPILATFMVQMRKKCGERCLSRNTSFFSPFSVSESGGSTV
jgi:hypothetical protein